MHRKTKLIMLISLLAFAVWCGKDNQVNAMAKHNMKTTVKTTKRVVKFKDNAKKMTKKRSSRKVRKSQYYSGEYQINKTKIIRKKVITKYAGRKKIIIGTVRTTVKTGKKKISVDNVKTYVDRKVLDAFKKLDYRIVINTKVSYAGYFNGADRTITLRGMNEGYLLHELGYFLSFVSGFRDSSAEFSEIYRSESQKYTGNNRRYVTQNSEEYFAESFRDYCLSPSVLRRNRPKTYQYMAASIDRITDEKIKCIKQINYD